MNFLQKSRGLVRFNRVKYLTPDWDTEELSILYDYVRGGETSIIRENIFEDSENIILLNSGRSAIKLLLLSIPNSSRNEVILPSYGCSGIIEPVLQSGYRPIFCDIGSDLNPSYNSIIDLVTSKTLALILPSLCGQTPLDESLIEELTERNGVLLIRDFAQDIDGFMNSKFDKSKFNAQILSFGIGKPLTATKGGALLFPDELKIKFDLIVPSNPIEVATNASSFRNTYVKRGFVSDMSKILLDKFGTKVSSKTFIRIESMSNLDRKLLHSQIPKISEKLAKRRKIAQSYDQMFTQPFESFEFHSPMNLGNSYSKYWLRNAIPGSRDITKLRSLLWSFGVESEGLYKPLHQRYDYSKFSIGKLPNTESVADDLFCLPVRSNLSAVELAYIQEIFKNVDRMATYG